MGAEYQPPFACVIPNTLSNLTHRKLLFVLQTKGCVMSDIPARYLIREAVVNGKTFNIPNGMSNRYDKCYIGLLFFSDKKMLNEVKPTGGTAKIQLSPDGSNFYDLDEGGTIDLATMYDPSYTLPSAQHPAVDASVLFTGVTGTDINYFKATFMRY